MDLGTSRPNPPAVLVLGLRRSQEAERAEMTANGRDKNKNGMSFAMARSSPQQYVPERDHVSSRLRLKRDAKHSRLRV